MSTETIKLAEIGRHQGRGYMRAVWSADKASVTMQFEMRRDYRTLACDKLSSANCSRSSSDERLAAVDVRLRIDNTATCNASILPAKVRDVGRSDARGCTAEARGDIVGDGGDLSVGI